MISRDDQKPDGAILEILVLCRPLQTAWAAPDGRKAKSGICQRPGYRVWICVKKDGAYDTDISSGQDEWELTL